MGIGKMEPMGVALCSALDLGVGGQLQEGSAVLWAASELLRLRRLPGSREVSYLFLALDFQKEGTEAAAKEG